MKHCINFGIKRLTQSGLDDQIWYFDSIFHHIVKAFVPDQIKLFIKTEFVSEIKGTWC